MKGLMRRLIVPLGVAIAVLGSVEIAFSQSITVTPSSQLVPMNGTSGGIRKTEAAPDLLPQFLIMWCK